MNSSSIQVDTDGDIPMSQSATWGWAFFFVTIINLSSIMGIIFFPLMKKSFYAMIMRTMIGLAIGSLSGSSLFHLIPAAFELEKTNAKGQTIINIALFIWLSIWLVMLIESSIKIIVKIRNQKPKEHKVLKEIKKRDDPEGQSALVNGDVQEDKSETKFKNEEDEDEAVDNVTVAKNPNRKNGDLLVYRSSLSLSKLSQSPSTSSNEPIKTVAWLVIIGDSLHNFIDGVSIGAGFVKDFRTGSIISLAIICEEFPHELGDFAILINSGFTVKGALAMNFMSALTCYLGMGIGLLLGEIEWSNYIFGFAAGIFLYVSLADMIPEIMGIIDEVCDINPRKAWKVLVTHNLGILVGITILYLLAAFQPQ